LRLISAAYSGGTAADSHGLPHFPCLQIGNSVYAGGLGVSMYRMKITRKKHLGRMISAILPVGFALFDECPEPFLRILETIQLVEENIHRVLHAIA
jgi:hypothetical protein